MQVFPGLSPHTLAQSAVEICAAA